MKKILQSILYLLAFSVPSFSEVKWDLGVDTNYEKILHIAQKANQLNDFEIESEIQVDIEQVLDNGMRVGLSSVTVSNINEDYDTGNAMRIVRLCVDYRF